MRRHGFGLLSALAAAAAVVAVSAAATGSVTIGSNLKPKPNGGYGCGPDRCTVMQRTLAGDPVKSPFDGKIRRWRIRKGPDGAGEVYEVRLWVVRRSSPDFWKFLRHTGYKTVEAPAGTYGFSSHLRIDRGDRIAIELSAGVHNGIDRPVDEGALLLGFAPAPDNGETAPPTYIDSNLEHYLNATIRRRD